MPTRLPLPARSRDPARSPDSRGAESLGRLPEWKLEDLYPGIDSPSVAADLDRALTDCKAFEQRYKGASVGRPRRAGTAPARLAGAIAAYEAIEDLLGRIASYAGLVYAGDTTDPKRAKFYGDVQERLTTASSASAVLHARAEPHRRRRLGRGARRCSARPLEALARGYPPREAAPARGPHRAALPREVGDRPRRLEPPVRRDDRRRCASRSTARTWRSSRR